MNKSELKILKKVQQEQIKFKDILGEHIGVINELTIRDNGIFAYGLFFGHNGWFKLNEANMGWEIYHITR